MNIKKVLNFYERLHTVMPTLAYMENFLTLIEKNNVEELKKFLNFGNVEFLHSFNNSWVLNDKDIENPLIKTFEKDRIEMFKFLIDNKYPFEGLNVFYIRKIMEKNLLEHFDHILNNHAYILAEKSEYKNLRFENKKYLINFMVNDAQYKISEEMFSKILPLFNEQIFIDLLQMSLNIDVKHFNKIIDYHNIDINNIVKRNPDLIFSSLNYANVDNFKNILNKLDSDFYSVKNENNETFLLCYFHKYFNLDRLIHIIKDYSIEKNKVSIFLEKFKNETVYNLTHYNKEKESILSTILENFSFLLQEIIPEIEGKVYPFYDFNNISLNNEKHDLIDVIAKKKMNAAETIKLLEIFNCEIKIEDRTFNKFKNKMPEEEFEAFKNYYEKKELEKILTNKSEKLINKRRM